MPLFDDDQKQKSLEQQALGGNAQQTQNFLTALKQSGAGSNNSFMNQAPAPQAAPTTPFLQNAKSNQNAGSTSFLGGFDATGGDLTKNSLGLVNNAVIKGSITDYKPGGGSNQAPLDGFTTGQAKSAFDGGQGTASWNAAAAAEQASNKSKVPQVPQLGNSGGNPPTRKPLPKNDGGMYPMPFHSAQPAWQALMSDETQKTDVVSGERNIQDFLNTIGAHEYEYKDKKFGKGRFTSPMAQELEKTELGKQAVKETPDGKMVDYGRLSGVMLAAQSMLNKRLNDLEREARHNLKSVKRK